MAEEIKVEVIFLDAPEKVEKSKEILIKAMQRIVDEAEKESSKEAIEVEGA
ncbi:hypothetical protein [Fuchsiella alkaliacetigena]|uniref:hypothetical protein n=1 Tax=Fuchsiella alkaliacetigena TaxID=957042 RepID=UPI002009F281|nr:hypothetical protein [Fuchsiella alkaliacetigena]MCK8826027.1 hypothetical protein [Fuchsiella alkaliacetigena]